VRVIGDDEATKFYEAINIYDGEDRFWEAKINAFVWYVHAGSIGKSPRCALVRRSAKQNVTLLITCFICMNNYRFL
jgi:hypothetical protein